MDEVESAQLSVCVSVHQADEHRHIYAGRSSVWLWRVRIGAEEYDIWQYSSQLQQSSFCLLHGVCTYQHNASDIRHREFSFFLLIKTSGGRKEEQKRREGREQPPYNMHINISPHWYYARSDVWSYTYRVEWMRLSLTVGFSAHANEQWLKENEMMWSQGRKDVITRICLQFKRILLNISITL